MQSHTKDLITYMCENFKDYLPHFTRNLYIQNICLYALQILLVEDMVLN